MSTNGTVMTDNGVAPNTAYLYKVRASDGVTTTAYTAPDLATTVIFLMLIQLTKGIGGKGMIPADLAAWLPSIIFGVVGVILFARVRT